MGLAYVRLQTAQGQMLLPNAQALAAAVLLIPDRPGADSAVPGAIQAERISGAIQADQVSGAGPAQPTGGGAGASEPVV